MKEEQRSNLLLRILIGIVKIIYNLTYYFFRQITALPKIIQSVFTDLKTRIIFKKIGYIIRDDLVPLLLVAYANNFIKKQAQAYFEKTPKLEISSNILLKTSLFLLQSAVSIYKMRKKTKILCRSTVLSIETAESLGLELKETHPSPCIEADCSKLRFVKGTFRDIISYEATNIAITFTRHLPFVGNILSKILDSYHKGRYLVTVTLASLEVCSRHQEEYLREYNELAMAYGLIYFLLTELPSRAIQACTGIPASFYKSTIQHIVIIIQILAGKHSNFPTLIKKSTRNLLDPVVAYVNFIGFIFDTLLLGLKKQISRLLKTEVFIPWKTILNSISKFWYHSVVEKLKIVFLPRMLRNKEAFIDDPVIPWDTLREKIIEFINELEHLQKNVFLKFFAHRTPKIAAKTIRLIFGTPIEITKLLFSLVTNEEFKMKLGNCRRELMCLGKENAPPILPILSSNQKYFSLRESNTNLEISDTESSGVLKKTFENAAQDNHVTSPIFQKIPDLVETKQSRNLKPLLPKSSSPINAKKAAIIGCGNTSSTKSRNMNLARSLRGKTVKTLDPAAVIKGNRNRFFSQNKQEEQFVSENLATSLSP